MYVGYHYKSGTFSKVMFSHKIYGAELRYEVGVSRYPADLIWVLISYPRGPYPDVCKFREDLKQCLDLGETEIYDNGYVYEN